MPRTRRRVLAVAVLPVLFLASAGCHGREDVDLSFRPRLGARYSYDVDVETTVVTTLAGPPERRSERLTLRAVERVVDDGRGGPVRLQLTLTRPDATSRRFELRVDRRGGLATIESVEGLPVEALGEIGPSRLFLLANGLVPSRRVGLGDRWRIARTLAFPEGRTHLSGQGRLTGLRVRAGTPVALVEAETRLPVTRTMTLPQGSATLDGTEQTSARIAYGVHDGAVRDARLETHGRFRLSVRPPGGAGRDPVEGVLEATVVSRTRPSG